MVGIEFKTELENRIKDAKTRWEISVYNLNYIQRTQGVTSKNYFIQAELVETLFRKWRALDQAFIQSYIV